VEASDTSTDSGERLSVAAPPPPLLRHDHSLALALANRELSCAVSRLLVRLSPNRERLVHFEELIRELVSRLEQVRALEHQLAPAPGAGASSSPSGETQ